MVNYGRHTIRSGRLLRQRLRAEGYTGRTINWGYGEVGDDHINNYEALQRASNKLTALRTMADNDIPTPKLFDRGFILYDGEENLVTPVVARPARHFGGREFMLCKTLDDYLLAKDRGYSVFTEFIEGGREFRLHIMNGKSIKIAEKVGGEGHIKNFANGWRFMYPQDFNHKKTLRRVCIEAVTALGLHFGAVDVIYKSGEYYVLEVNTAPSLTSESDTLDRYVKGFMEYYDR